jgi:hypothetical protein
LNLRMKSLYAITIFLIVSISLKGQVSDLYINEFKAFNTKGLQDEFYDYPDWIELYNSGLTAVDLDGYSLTDNIDNITKWIFPSYTIEPGGYLYVFASGKDIKTPPVIWSTVIDYGDEWAYTVPDSEIPGWNTPGFSDAGWNTGNSGFGYGDDDDATIIPAETMCVYVRKEFTVNNTENINRAILHVDCDDAFIAYLNGTEVARYNIGTPGSTVAYTDPADTYVEAKIKDGIPPDAYDITNISDYLQEGTNLLALELHNQSSTSSDLTLIPFLSLGYNNYEGTPYVNGLLNLSGSSFHTNFQLNLDGEFIGLYDATGNVMDSITYTTQLIDISYGRSSADPEQWGFFNIATPGYENGAVSLEFAGEPQFSIQGGFYSGSQSLILSAESPAAEIYYTIDGTVPDTNSTLYETPLILDSTIAIRAITVEKDKISSNIITQTYFIDEDINMPFISLVTDPDNFFSDETGIYVTGTNGIPGSCDATVRNVNRDWERPVNIEFYDPTGELGFNQVAGIKIFGGCSRTRFPQKSLALYARRAYGAGEFAHQIFSDKQIENFESFLLRSAADDQQRTFMRDPLSQEVLVEYMDIEYQAFRPAAVFLNGEYFGIHNIREKLNEHYFAENFDIDTSYINILERNASLIYGDKTNYTAMMNFIQSNNMADSSNYEYIRTQMDIENFIEYEIANIYLGEVDWPGNNIKYWRSNTGKYTKWRWLNLDKDQCFFEYRIPTNTLELATATNGPSWPNPPWSTLLLRKLLENEDFKNSFIQLYAYHLSTTFNPERLINHIDSFQAMLAPEIPRHTERWGDQKDPDSAESWQLPTFESLEEWLNFVDELRLFAQDRPPYAIQHLMDKFGLGTRDNLSISTNPQGSGIIKLYNRKVPDNGYSGDYFRGIPIRLKAIPDLGYSFSHWIATEAGIDKTYTAQQIEITLNHDMELTAYFEEVINIDEPIVAINEINYHSSAVFDPQDWIELYNRLDNTIDLTGWYLKDSNEDNVYQLQDGLELDADSYMVICENVAAFNSLFPEVYNRTGDLGFKLSNGGEVIRLYAYDNSLIDSVRYDDDAPWPALADGMGSTMELIDTDLDNDLGQNWTASAQLYGSPGSKNGLTTGMDEKLADTSIDMLMQNYPNPFTATTIITYSITVRCHVSLTVYDILGNEIVSLVNRYQDADIYSIEFNGSGLSAGIYLYTLKLDGNPIQTRKMIINH